MSSLKYHIAVAGALLALPACPSDKVGDTTTGTAGTTTNTTTTASGTTLEPTSVGTTSTPTSTDGSSSSTTGPGATDTTDASSTAGQTCSPGPVDACPVTQCLEGWSYECPGCEFIGGDCFEIDVGCSYPALACDLPRPCERVWGIGYDSIESFESEEAAICLLTALRDGTPGAYEVLWGEMLDDGWVVMTVYSGGQGVVLLEWAIDCPGCPESGQFRRSGQLALQPAAFFDDCLAAPDTAGLIQCVFGFVDFDAGLLPPADQTPPWTTGECVSLEIACPT